MKKRGFNHSFYEVFAVFLLIAVVISWLWALKEDEPKVIGYGYITGTSLWDLSRNCPDSMDKRDYIAEIMALNEMNNTLVYADRLYQVPIYEVQ